MIISLIGWMEGVNVGRHVAAHQKTKLFVNREFFAVGMCNVVASFFQCTPVAGSNQRTKMNLLYGAKSMVSRQQNGKIAHDMFSIKLI